MPPEKNTLPQYPIFEALSPITIRQLQERLIERHYPPDHNLVLEGMPAKTGYFILDGEVRVLRSSPEGRIQVLARMGEGHPVNLISLLRQPPINQSSVDTLTRVYVLALTKSDFSDLVEQCPDFAKTLLIQFAHRIAHMTNLAADLALYPVEVRLARFLIDLADQTQSPTGWTQDEIAAQIGTIRDVVGRSLRKFEADGLIERHHGQILLQDRAGLTALAKLGNE